MPGKRRLSPIHKRKNNKKRIKKEIDKKESNTTPKLLPLELWGKILEHLWLDDVISCMDINRFFRDHVSTSIHTLFIKPLIAHLLRLPPTSHLKRLSNVKRVYIYSLISESRENHGGVLRETTALNADELNRENESMSTSDESEGPRIYHLDQTTLEHILPFLLQFPRLEFAFLGGLDVCGINERCAMYSVNKEYDLEDSTIRFARLIQAVGDAYVASSLKPNVYIQGIVTDQICQDTGYSLCARRNVVTIPGYRTDVACQMCDFICQTFPVDQVCDFSSREIPCISAMNRLSIALSRDPATVRPKLTDMLLQVLSLSWGRCMRVELPQECFKYVFATDFTDEQLEKMEWMIKNGANLSDVRLRHELVMIGWDNGLYEKRVMSREMFEKLKLLGLEIDESDFALIDDDTESDHD